MNSLLVIAISVVFEAVALVAVIIAARYAVSEKRKFEELFPEAQTLKTRIEFYREENQRLVGANQNLAEILFSRAELIAELGDATDIVCEKCGQTGAACEACHWHEVKRDRLGVGAE